MKIDAPRPVQAGAARRVRAKAGDGAAFHADETEQARPAPVLADPAGIASVDALLALQGAEDALSAPMRARARAHDMLDALDALKLSLLEGLGGAEAAARLQSAARRDRVRTQDAGLEAILDAVDVRAAVELAKREARQGERPR